MRCMQKWIAGIAAFALAMGACAAQQGGEPDQNAILKGLAGDNFSVREEAQLALE